MKHDVVKELFSRLSEQNARGRIMAIRHLADIKEEIEKNYREGTIDEDLGKEYLRFTFDVPGDEFECRSIIIVAAPQPHVRVIFTWNGKKIPVMIPPTYMHYKEIYKQIRDDAAAVLRSANYHAAPTSLPEKILAAHSGLSAYGKNNISYIPGMGSYYQLVSFYSDLPPEEDSWTGMQMVEKCETCSACIRSCPSDAIAEDRFLLHAERCITFYNERPGDFPEWMNPSWHNCLIGCLVCQRVCPLNKEVEPWIEEKAVFSQEETESIIEGTALDKLPDKTVIKLKQIDIMHFFDVLHRNLEILLRK